MWIAALSFSIWLIAYIMPLAEEAQREDLFCRGDLGGLYTALLVLAVICGSMN